ncbi:MAG TPA: DUF1254 domain-containing protein [Edaphobacter sp.]|nr:DUF1254 domain-containing protein [Edaphobacter sp.]
MTRKHKLIVVVLAGALALATGCNEKSAPSSATTSEARTPPQMKMTTPIPPSITTPDFVDTRIGTLKFRDGFPDDPTVQKVYDNLDFIRGIEAFLTAMPGASTEAVRVGFASQGADNNHTVLIMEDLMDSKSLFLTPNTDSIYNMMWLDTKDGPLVIETPPNVLGVIDDHWFQYVTDFGRVGPDKNKGGKFLLLPLATTVRCLRATLSCIQLHMATSSSGADLSKTVAPNLPWKAPRSSPKSIGSRTPKISRR